MVNASLTPPAYNPGRSFHAGMRAWERSVPQTTSSSGAGTVETKTGRGSACPGQSGETPGSSFWRRRLSCRRRPSVSAREHRNPAARWPARGFRRGARRQFTAPRPESSRRRRASACPVARAGALLTSARTIEGRCAWHHKVNRPNVRGAIPRAGARPARVAPGTKVECRKDFTCAHLAQTPRQPSSSPLRQPREYVPS